MAGIARPNPEARIEYPRDAYAGAPGAPARARRVTTTDEADGDEDEVVHRGSSPWLWLSILLAIGVLALAAFLVSRLLGGPETSAPPQVEVPSFVGMTFTEAQAEAAALGLEVEQSAFVQASAEFGTVTSQNPPAGETVDQGTTIELTMAVGPETTIVPDLRLKTESEAINLIFAAGLVVGTRTEAADPVVPEGSVISQVPGPSLDVARGTPVDYVVSTGPEETPTPAPTPPPTPTPTPFVPPPTPTPPTERTVGDYRCSSVLALAQAEIVSDGFTVGTIHGSNDPAAVVVWQNPQPGTQHPVGTAIELWTVDQPAPTCPAPPG